MGPQFRELPILGVSRASGGCAMITRTIIFPIKFSQTLGIRVDGGSRSAANC